MASVHEYIEYAPGKFEELLDTVVVTGTIISVDYENDTAVVTIPNIGDVSGVPIFYHCPGSEVVKGGSAAFSEDDSVYILNKEGILTITGFVDGLRVCIIKIKLYRGDGVPLIGYYGMGPEEDGYLITWLYLINSEGDWIAQTAVYDSGTGYWTLTVDNDEDKDPNGYWIEYGCKRGLDSQYPYRYIEARQAEDLVKGGDYIDIIPYSHVSLFMTSSEDECYPGIRSYINSAERGTTNKLSVSYDVKYTIEARSIAPGPDWCSGTCMGVGWILEAFDLSFGPIQSAWEWADKSTTESGNTPTVEIPLSVATEIAIILSATPDPDWAAFNAQFQGIVIGEGGIGERIHTAYFKRSGSAYEIRVNAWKEAQTIVK